MYSNIKQLRRCGVKRSETDIANDPGVFGELTLHKVGGHLRLAVREFDNPIAGDLFAPLFEAVCLGWGGSNMTWRGFQAPANKNPDRAAYLQEWRVELISERPPPEVINSMRSPLSSHRFSEPK